MRIGVSGCQSTEFSFYRIRIVWQKADDLEVGKLSFDDLFVLVGPDSVANDCDVLDIQIPGQLTEVSYQLAFKRKKDATALLEELKSMGSLQNIRFRFNSTDTEF